MIQVRGVGCVGIQGRRVCGGGGGSRNNLKGGMVISSDFEIDTTHGRMNLRNRCVRSWDVTCDGGKKW